MKNFCKLTQTHVDIGIGSGRSIRVEMLPIELESSVDRITREVLALINSPVAGEAEYSRSNELRAEILSIVGPRLPENIRANLNRFALDELASLLCYLMRGDGDGSAPESREDAATGGDADPTPTPVMASAAPAN